MLGVSVPGIGKSIFESGAVLAASATLLTGYGGSTKASPQVKRYESSTPRNTRISQAVENFGRLIERAILSTDAQALNYTSICTQTSIIPDGSAPYKQDIVDTEGQLDTSDTCTVTLGAHQEATMIVGTDQDGHYEFNRIAALSVKKLAHCSVNFIKPESEGATWTLTGLPGNSPSTVLQAERLDKAGIACLHETATGLEIADPGLLPKD